MLQQDIDLLYIEHAGMMMNGSVLKNRPHCNRLLLAVHKMMMMATATMMIIWWWWWMGVFWKIGQTVMDCYWCKRRVLGPETDIWCSDKSQKDYELRRWWSISINWENRIKMKMKSDIKFCFQPINGNDDLIINEVNNYSNGTWILTRKPFCRT